MFFDHCGQLWEPARLKLGVQPSAAFLTFCIYGDQVLCILAGSFRFVTATEDKSRRLFQNTQHFCLSQVMFCVITIYDEKAFKKSLFLFCYLY